MKTHLILAHDEDYGIGLNNGLPWELPEDLALFKHITNGSAVIMGRKTFESLPFKNGLPGRLNIIITRNTDLHDGKRYVGTISDAIALATDKGYHNSFVIGGKSIYENCLDYIDGNIYISEVDGKHVCDTYIHSRFYNKMDSLDFVNVHKKFYQDFDLNIYKRIKDI